MVKFSKKNPLLGLVRQKKLKYFFFKQSRFDKLVLDINCLGTPWVNFRRIALYKRYPRKHPNSKVELRLLNIVRPYCSNLNSLLNLKSLSYYSLRGGNYSPFLKSLVRILDLNFLEKHIRAFYLNSFKATLEKVALISSSYNQPLSYFNFFREFRRPWTLWRLRDPFFTAVLPRYFRLYQVVGLPIILGLYKKFNSLSYNPYEPIFNLYWTFNSNQKLFINLTNNLTRVYNYLSLYSGIFLKFFKNRKPLRKSKLFKTLMVKFLRKIILTSSIKKVNLVINRGSYLFSELYKSLFTPTIVPYVEPITKSLYNDSLLNRGTPLFEVKKVIFRRIHSFSNLKVRKRGRIKRKIVRRLLKKNSVLD